MVERELLEYYEANQGGAGALPPTVGLAKVFSKLDTLTKHLMCADLEANPFAREMQATPSLKQFAEMVYAAPFEC